MFVQLRSAFMMIVLMTALTGLAYPLAVTGIAQLAFPGKANGSVIVREGKVVGSALIGQSFTSPRYFHGRPSATTAPNPADSTKTIDAPYNAANSSGSNLGPTSKKLVDRVSSTIEAEFGQGTPTPLRPMVSRLPPRGSTRIFRRSSHWRRFPRSPRRAIFRKAKCERSSRHISNRAWPELSANRASTSSCSIWRWTRRGSMVPGHWTTSMTRNGATR